MTVSTHVNRENCDDIPVTVEVEQDEEFFRCSEEAVVEQNYLNNDMSATVYQVGDKIYLTDAERKQVEEKCSEDLFESMSPSQRRNYESEQYYERNGLR